MVKKEVCQMARIVRYRRRRDIHWR